MAGNDIHELAQSGLAALRAGNASVARTRFEAVVARGGADASIFLALAIAYHRLNDATSALQAVNQALAREPQNLRALIFKADVLDQMEDRKGAAAYYLAAVRAVPNGAELPPDLRADLARAQSQCGRLAGTLEQALVSRLGGTERLTANSSPRFRESLDILLGRKPVYLQDPRYYYMPGMPQKSFYDRGDFPWIESLETHTAEIRTELLSVLAEPAAFRPYVQGAVNRPQHAQGGMVNNPDWSAFYLWKDGELITENAARCPRTIDVMKSIPMVHVVNRSPSVLFSLMRPGAHIPAHTGLVNTRLICHLPLIVPKGCTFRVGNEERDWVEGQTWVFDDTMEHEAWNRSQETRVVLLFEVWQPALTMNERDDVCAMFAAIDAESGVKPVWEI